MYRRANEDVVQPGTGWTTRHLIVALAVTAAGYVIFAFLDPSGLGTRLGLVGLGSPLGVAVAVACRVPARARMAVVSVAGVSVLALAVVDRSPWVIAVSAALVVGLEAWVLSTAITRQGWSRLAEPLDVFRIAGLSAAVAAVAGALVGLVAWATNSLQGGAWNLTLTWAIDDVFGLLVVMPAFLLMPSLRRWNWRRAPEFTLILATSIVSAVYLFAWVDPANRGVLGWPYLIIIGPLWAALRMGGAASAPVAAISFLLGIRLTLEGLGTFSGTDAALQEHLQMVQTLGIVVSVTTLLAAVLRDGALRALRSAHDSNLFLREVMDAYGDPVFAKAYGPDEPQGRYVLVNDGWARGTGVPAGEAIGHSDLELLPEPVGQMIWENDQQILQSDRPRTLEERLGPPGEPVRIFASTKFPLHDASGKAWGIGGVAVDVTDAVRARELEQRNLALMHAVFDLSPTPSLRVSVSPGAEACVEAANAALLTLLGRAPHDPLETDLYAFVASGQHDAVREALRCVIETGGRAEAGEEIRLLSTSARETWARMSVALIAQGDADTAAEVVVQFEDVTLRRLAERALTEQATLDALTGLPNRRALQDRLDQAVSRLQRHPATVAVMFCDLDHFKDVNDSLGHAVGDLMLMEVAERLRSAMRPEDTVARLGGDEFVILAEGLADPSMAMVVALRLLESLARPWSHGGDLYSLSMSIGVAMTSDPEQSTEELLRQADLAMYRAKDRGRNRMEFYDRSDDELVQRTISIQRDLESALAEDRLVLMYQPVVDLVSGRVEGAEALVRLRRPDGAVVPPGDFIPYAEANGLVIPMGAWVIRQALDDARRWQAEGAQRVVAVNVSPSQLRQPGFADSFLEQAGHLGIDVRYLGVEVTEHALIRDPRGSAKELQLLHDAGVTVALDDFGTGYSSLAWLTEYPVDVLKIDRSFTDEITSNVRKASIVRAVIDVAHDIGISVIAEGVETAEQREMLIELGCERAQGYLFSRPLSTDDVYWATSDVARLESTGD